MDGYRLVLFLHLCALLGAIGTAALLPARLAQIAREHVGGIASWTNTGLALGIVFVMTTKPALTGSLAALVVAAGLGAVVALRLRRIGRDRVS